MPSTANPEPATTESTPTWPVETNLFFAPGVTKLMLTIQRPLIRTVIQDTIEVLRATLTFDNAFPDGPQTIAFVRQSLITAAEKPTAMSVHQRLLQDDDYMSKIVPVVCTLSYLAIRGLQTNIFKAACPNTSVP